MNNMHLLILPFILLLLSYAIGPLLVKESTWEKASMIISFTLAGIILSYFIFLQKDFIHPIESFYEYLQFILLITALYLVAGIIKVEINITGNALNNTLLLLCGAICANFIGTTGAAMIFIHPFMSINYGRLKPYHISFFIFLVCNIGGSLSIIGDPPLYLGFLKGIPFSSTLIHNFKPWVGAIGILLVIFYIIDSKNENKTNFKPKDDTNLISIHGYENFLWLGIIIASLFIDVNIFPNLPSFQIGHNKKICIIREVILLVICYILYRKNENNIATNAHFLPPIKDLMILFFGIFITMPPVLEEISKLTNNIDGTYINNTSLFWLTGILSSFLDNAPTYLNMLTISMAKYGLSIDDIANVKEYANTIDYIPQLRAISIASIFFGGMTYISNGPNFLIKSIAEKNDVKMPSFFGFIVHYSCLFLVPLLVFIWLVFIR